MKSKVFMLICLFPVVLYAQNRLVEVVEKHPFPIGYVSASYAHEIAFDNTGLMWIAVQISSVGILQYNGSDWFSIAVEPHDHHDGEDDRRFHGLASDHNVCVKIDPKGRIWIGSTGHGVSRLIDTTWRTFGTSSKLGHGVVQDILVIEDTAWIATRNGLSKLVGDSVLKTYRIADGLPDANITCLCQDAVGNLWVGTAKGLARFDGTNFVKYFPLLGNLSDNYVDALVMDRDNVVWAAIYNSGLWKFDGTSWNLFFDEELSFTALTVDNRGRIWAGSKLSGVYRYNGRSWKHYTLDDGLYDASTSAIAVDREGAVWVGAFGGLTKIYDTLASTDNISSFDLENSIHVYPNPATDNIFISLREMITDAVFTLYDMQGKVLIRQKIANEDMVSINNLAAGIYIYNVSTAKGTVNGKVVVVNNE
ncbi:MAG: T9SS type A sorting domain-containing protein [Bacteroidales bacterium]|jgi:ligand-binding sensor domain-containing protein|nr:T9SS type A sorting domain-containing protein [Bacteroidales bacterium]